MAERIVFVDVETTGLDPDRHEVWEIAIMTRGKSPGDGLFSWQVDADLGLADPAALRVNRYYERAEREPEYAPDVAYQLANWTRGAYLAAANPAFDAAFLARFLRRNGQCPMWHHRLICVESMAMAALGVLTPMGLRDSADALDVEYNADDLHTAAGDVRLARDVYDAALRRGGTP